MYLVNNNNKLLRQMIDANINTCNEIHKHIDRTPKKKSDADFMLVKSFNTLVEVNQRALDILYPERHESGKIPKAKHLVFKQTEEDNEDVVEIIEMEVETLKQEFNWEK